MLFNIIDHVLVWGWDLSAKCYTCHLRLKFVWYLALPITCKIYMCLKFCLLLSFIFLTCGYVYKQSILFILCALTSPYRGQLVTTLDHCDVTNTLRVTMEKIPSRQRHNRHSSWGGSLSPKPTGMILVNNYIVRSYIEM